MQPLISLYIHIPFCVKKCLFCSFAVVIAQTKRADEYVGALGQEARAFEGRALQTIYLGGGTPSLLPTDELSTLVGMVRDRFVVDENAEWTIEANPETIDAARARFLKSAGFTRVSLGVQSFNDAYLKFLGRNHDHTQAQRAFDALRDAGFVNINVDLMYGFPRQQRAELSDDIAAVAALGSEHVSIYTLTVEPNSRFFARQMKLDDDGKLADDYVFVTSSLEGAGLMQYEVSNFARPGHESRHNMVYWQGGDYIGLGMGAHSLLGNRRSWNKETLPEYLGDMASKGSAVDAFEELTAQTRLMEKVIFGLRMNQGIDLVRIQQDSGLSVPPDRKELIAQFIRGGLLQQAADGRIATTMQGRLVLDEIASRLI